MKWILTSLVLMFGVIVGGLWIYAPRSSREENSAENAAAEAEAAEVKAAELDPAKQKRIWDAEHVTFEIERRFGKSLIRAIVDSNRPRLREFFRDGFQGSVLSETEASTRKVGLITEVRREAADGNALAADADRVVTSLLAPVGRFKKIERTRLRGLSIERIAETDRWKARLLITLVGTSKAGGPALFESEHLAEFRIVDEMAIDKAAVIASWQTQSQSLRTSPRFLMEETTRKAGLAELPIPDNWRLPVNEIAFNRFQFAAADFDRDGFLDVAVATMSKNPMLLKSVEGRTFQDVASSVGIIAPRTGLRSSFVAAWIDYDNDGYPDLVLGSRLYHNVEGKWFEDVTIPSGFRIASLQCMGCIVADYDCDGLLDIYVLHQAPALTQMERNSQSDAPQAKRKSRWVGESNSGGENQLWRNLGGGRFRDVTRETGSGGGKRHTHAAAWFFYDNDRFPDLYIANDFGSNVVLRNRGNGTFEDVSNKSGAHDFATSMGVATGDVNNDGRSDIYVANMYSKMGRRIVGQVCEQDYPEGIYRQIQGSCAGNRLYLKNDKNGYRETSGDMGVNSVGWAYAPAMVDLDGDGWLDLYATTGFMSFEREKPDG